MPDEELLQFDVPVIQEEWHGGHRKVECLKRGLEIDKPVAARNFKEPVPEMGLDQPAFSRDA